MTLSFLTLSISRLLHAFNMCHPKANTLNNEITQPDTAGWLFVVAPSLIPLILGQLYIVVFKSERRSGV